MKSTSLLLVLSLSSLLTQAQVTTFALNEEKYNQPLKKVLDSVFNEDQSIRAVYFQAKKDNAAVARLDSLRTRMQKVDAQNQELVNTILKKHGWLGPEKVGMIGSQALFLVIQHANLKTQEAYLPMIRTAEKNGEILSSNLAILEDRINMRNGKKQFYGSQGFIDLKTGKSYTYPIIDVENLDKRRKKMGMPPMETYVKGWNLQDYIKELPMIEELVRTQNIERAKF